MSSAVSWSHKDGEMTDEHEYQYVAVTFGPVSKRTYTYHNDEVEGLKVGDKVAVPAHSDGWVTATVAELDVPKPSFNTKRVIRRIENEEDTNA